MVNFLLSSNNDIRGNFVKFYRFFGKKFQDPIKKARNLVCSHQCAPLLRRAMSVLTVSFWSSAPAQPSHSNSRSKKNGNRQEWNWGLSFVSLQVALCLSCKLVPVFHWSELNHMLTSGWYDRRSFDLRRLDLASQTEEKDGASIVRKNGHIDAIKSVQPSSHSSSWDTTFNFSNFER